MNTRKGKEAKKKVRLTIRHPHVAQAVDCEAAGRVSYLERFDFAGIGSWETNNFVRDGVGNPDPVRVIVSAKDPGYANWICTGGLRIGMITVRWNEKEGEEHMETKLVNFDQISEAMPAKSAKVNPEDRQLLLQALRTHILSRYGR